MAEKQYCSYEQVSLRPVLMHLDFDVVSELEVEAAAGLQAQIRAGVRMLLLILLCFFFQIQSLIRHAVVDKDVFRDFKPTLIICIAAGG